MKRAWVGLAFLSLACSGGELTELLVVVDSDLSVPGELDGVRVTATGAEAMSAAGAITSDEPLPRTVGIVHREGMLGPVEVTVVGTQGGDDVVQARVTTSFVQGKTLVLPVFLSRRCADPQACVLDVDPSSLDEWNGSVPRVDAGPSCVPSAEVCNGEDDDCDGRVDEDFDLERDAQHCGGCGNVCSVANATASCEGGSCEIDRCEGDFENCDGDPSNGCEVDTNDDDDHCGRCDNACRRWDECRRGRCR